jgi:hypothetical protein
LLSTLTEKREKSLLHHSTFFVLFGPTQRSANDDATDDTALEELIWYNAANDVILELLNQRIRNTKSTGVWK